MAIAGISVAFVMFVLMIAGVVRLNAVQERANQMGRYVATLQAENAQLRQTYESSYDLEEIRQFALTRGMVCADSVQQVQLQVSVPQEAQAPSAWENFLIFLTGLFA